MVILLITSKCYCTLLQFIQMQYQKLVYLQVDSDLWVFGKHIIKSPSMTTHTHTNDIEKNSRAMQDHMHSMLSALCYCLILPIFGNDLVQTEIDLFSCIWWQVTNKRIEIYLNTSRYYSFYVFLILVRNTSEYEQNSSTDSNYQPLLLLFERNQSKDWQRSKRTL